MQKSVEIYDVKKDIWEFGPDLNDEMMSMTLTVVDNRFIYQFGGLSFDRVKLNF